MHFNPIPPDHVDASTLLALWGLFRNAFACMRGWAEQRAEGTGFRQPKRVPLDASLLDPGAQ
jgi:hypothetical protein